MSTTTEKPAASPPTGTPRSDVLRVSAYDNTASMIVALLLVIGFCVLVMFAIWWTMRAVARQELPPVVEVELAGADDGPKGNEREVTEPTPEEFVDPLEPPPTERLDNLADVIALKKESFEAFDPPTGTGQGTGTGTGSGSGGSGKGVKPPVWEIRFSSTSLEVYARQLDFFKFELAAVGGDNPRIDYLSNLSQATATHRVGSGADETRPYFTWKRGSALAENDRKLMAKAGVPIDRRIILQYYPEAVYQQLAQLERLAAKGKRAEKTIFGVVPSNDGFEFKVDQQVLASGP